MVRLILFSITFFVYTLVSALSHAGHPAGYRVQVDARIPGVCPMDTKSAKTQWPDKTLTL